MVIKRPKSQYLYENDFLGLDNNSKYKSSQRWWLIIT